MSLSSNLLQPWARSRAINRQPLILPPHTPVSEATACMSQCRASCVLIVEQQRLVGIFTERDVVRMTATDTQLETVEIQEVMTSDPIALCIDDNQCIFSVLYLLRQHQIRHLPVVEQSGQVLGLITPRSLRDILKPADLFKFKRVANVMTTQVIQDSPTVSLMQVTQKMATHGKSCVVMTEIRGNGDVFPVGIITERDIVQFRTLGLDFSTIQAQEVMSKPLLPIEASESLWFANQVMKHHHLRRLVVVDEAGRLAGIITQSTLLQAIDPVEMYATIEILQQEAQERTAQLNQLNDQLQQEIAQHQQEIQVRTVLEQQLLEQNAQLQKAIAAAEAANLVKSTFLANMSHELRTPLHAILGFTQLLQDDTSLSSQHQEYLTIIRHSGEHLLNLINNLLELSKMKAECLIESQEDVARFATHGLNATQPEVVEPSPESLAKLAEGIAALPADWLADFRQGIIEGDLDWVLTLIAQIHECNEPLAKALTSLANTFQFEELLTLTQKSH